MLKAKEEIPMYRISQEVYMVDGIRVCNATVVKTDDSITKVVKNEHLKSYMASQNNMKGLEQSFNTKTGCEFICSNIKLYKNRKDTEEAALKNDLFLKIKSALWSGRTSDSFTLEELQKLYDTVFPNKDDIYTQIKGAKEKD